MKRIRQKFEEIDSTLSRIESSWMDGHAAEVISMLTELPVKPNYRSPDVISLLNRDFKVGFTVIRLFMDQSKDEFGPNMRKALGSENSKLGFEVKRFKKDPTHYAKTLMSMGLGKRMAEAMNRELQWYDVLSERLKSGRGSAIKGLGRGRKTEDFVEEILLEVFAKDQIAIRCRFTGANGLSTEKADFAIPSAKDPAILIEVKAYGATGSKQSDILGDAARIIAEKRDDTHFILVTDGITWKQRASDLRKLVELQNTGKILKIYTKAMALQLKEDLETLKSEQGL